MAEKTENIWLLDNVEIASPCPKSWDEMQGDYSKRFCEECGHHVYNFSGMTRDAAETLLRETEGRLCARIYRREDGAVMTSDCPKSDEVPRPQGAFARWNYNRKRNLLKKRMPYRLPNVPFEEMPHLSGIVARPTSWTTNEDESSTRSADETQSGTKNETLRSSDAGE